jgi:16S rRNA (cytosine1402-N4)-methyltransferase
VSEEAESAGERQPSMHEPVMLREVVARLRPAPGEVHVDGTLGLGGHAVEILRALEPSGLLVGIDRDAEALALAEGRLRAVGNSFRLFQGEFSGLKELLQLAGLPPEGAVDGLLLDLGVSSLQLDRPERGFSFQRSGPLDMRMTSGQGESAMDFLRRVSPEDLEGVLRDYGEEPRARRIARAIVEARGKEGLETTGDLARIVESVVPREGKRTHPATRTFQGIRIAVNRELVHLRSILRILDRVVKPGGRVVVLSYHSLEDRLVKASFREGAREGFFRIDKDDPGRPSREEIEANPRSRSARLRSVVRV